jgi:hypothetical protein
VTTPTRHTPVPVPDERDRLHLLLVIEDAERETRICPCGERMVVAASDDAVWLECPTFREVHEGRLGWLRSGLREVLHERRTIVTGIAPAA